MPVIVHKNKDGSYTIANAKTGRVYVRSTFTPGHDLTEISNRPSQRKLGRRKSSRKTRQATLSIGQFNILAGNLGTKEHFPYVQPKWLHWPRRKQRIVGTLLALNADILCCQEMNDFWTFFRPALAEHGYDSVYVQRPSSSTDASGWSGRFKNDGCAIFYRSNILRLEQAYSLVFADKYDRVALFAHFTHRASRKQFVVTTTHLYWDSKQPEVQLAELREIEAVLFALLQETSESLPVFLVGDFNNGPESTPISFVRENMLNQGFASAYGAPEFTSYNYRRKWTIDYIFYQPDKVQVSELARLPSVAEVTADPGPVSWDPQSRGIPNSLIPSDHVPLRANFTW